MEKFIIIIALFALSCEYKTELPQILKINSQRELDEWKCELEGLTEFNGDIQIQPAFDDTASVINITDLSAFANLRKINGYFQIASTTINSLSSLNNLEEVESLLIFSNHNLKEVKLSNLKTVNEKFTISGNNNIQSLSLPAVTNLRVLFLLDNPKFEKVEGFTNLNFLINLVVQRCNLQTIDGFDNLGYCEDKLDLQFTNMKVAQGSFKKFESANRISIIADTHDGNFSWLGAIKNYGAFSIAGHIQLEALCPIKSALRSPNFGLFSWQGNNVVFYNSVSVENECK